MTKNKMTAASAAEMIHVDCHPERSRDIGEANASRSRRTPCLLAQAPMRFHPAELGDSLTAVTIIPSERQPVH
jgi:hypothetical protein